MISLFEELSAKLIKNPRLSSRSGARYDMILLLFNARDAIYELWKSADRYLQTSDADALAHIQENVEKLRSIFGARKEYYVDNSKHR
ncbi:hypothetical protein JXB12_06660 [candidate division KSB1 bacterium]|nr:hypothetical protein [candidate division KSB1 bacterium]